MSGECDNCHEHCLDCKCEYSSHDECYDFSHDEFVSLDMERGFIEFSVKDKVTKKHKYYELISLKIYPLLFDGKNCSSIVRNPNNSLDI